MQQIAPSGPIYQAGTLSGNPVAMAAGLAMLELIQAPGFHDALEAQHARAVRRPRSRRARSGRAVHAPTASARMFGLFFSAEKVDTYAQAIACDTAAFNRFFHAMLERGVYLAPSAFEAGFLSSAHGDAEIAHTLDAARAAFATTLVIAPRRRWCCSTSTACSVALRPPPSAAKPSAPRSAVIADRVFAALVRHRHRDRNTTPADIDDDAIPRRTRRQRSTAPIDPAAWRAARAASMDCTAATLRTHRRPRRSLRHRRPHQQRPARPRRAAGRA